MPPYRPIADRFWDKLSIQPNGCWFWTAYKDRNGYGYIKGEDKRSPISAHRFSYELYRSNIQEGLVLDHLCRKPACVNPHHLEVVTQLENVRRGNSGKPGKSKTHCPMGHEYNEENTYTYKNRRGYLNRSCKACHLISTSKSYYKLKEGRVDK